MWLKSDENKMAATTIRTDMQATFGHAEEKDSTVNHMKFHALRATKVAFSKAFVFRELTADNLKWSIINRMTINAFLSEKNELFFFKEYISAETFIFLSGEGVP